MRRAAPAVMMVMCRRRGLIFGEDVRFYFLFPGPFQVLRLSIAIVCQSQQNLEALVIFVQTLRKLANAMRRFSPFSGMPH